MMFLSPLPTLYFQPFFTMHRIEGYMEREGEGEGEGEGRGREREGVEIKTVTTNGDAIPTAFKYCIL